MDQIHRQLLVVLKRETLKLMDLSFKQKLSQESSKNLINYLKLVKDLGKTEVPSGNEPEAPEQEDFTDMSDEELRELATKHKPGA